MVPIGASKRHQNGALVQAKCKFCKIGYASSVFISRNTEMTQDRPKMTPRWSICTRWPRDGRRWPQNGPNWSLKATPKWCSRVGEVLILLNRLCRRRSSLREGPRRPKVALRGPKMSKNGPKTAQDGPKMAPRRFRDDAKTDKIGALV